jgi:hypothetical protein
MPTTKGQSPPKYLYGSTFWWVLAPIVCTMEQNLSTIFMETQTLLERTNFSFQLIQTPKFVYFNGLLPCPLVLLREVCTRSSVPNGHSVKHPWYQDQRLLQVSNVSIFHDPWWDHHLRKVTILAWTGIKSDLRIHYLLVM